MSDINPFLLLLKSCKMEGDDAAQALVKVGMMFECLAGKQGQTITFEGETVPWCVNWCADWEIAHGVPQYERIEEWVADFAVKNPQVMMRLRDHHERAMAGMTQEERDYAENQWRQ